ncbi:hypothetical protein ACHAWC_007358 [Mediolabrus comicus]
MAPTFFPTIFFAVPLDRDSSAKRLKAHITARPNLPTKETLSCIVMRRDLTKKSPWLKKRTNKVSWLEESDEDNLGNESQKKLFEDADLNGVCNAVTEEEETDDVNALGGMPFEETDDFKVDADDVNALPPVTEIGGGLTSGLVINKRSAVALVPLIEDYNDDVSLLVSPGASEIGTINDEEAGQVETAVTPRLSLVRQRRESSKLARLNKFDYSRHVVALTGPGEVIANVRITNHGAGAVEHWYSVFEKMEDNDTRIRVKFIKNIYSDEWIREGEWIVFIAMDDQGCPITGSELKHMMETNTFNIKLKVIGGIGSWLIRLSMAKVRLIWLNQDAYYQTDRDVPSLSNTELDDEQVIFNGTTWLPNPEPEPEPEPEHEVPTTRSTEEPAPSTKSVPNDTETAPTAEMTASSSSEDEDSRGTLQIQLYQGVGDNVSVLTETPEAFVMTGENCVDDNHEENLLSRALKTIATVNDTTTDGLVETKLVREDVRRGVGEVRGDVSRGFIKVDKEVSKVDKKVDDVDKKVEDVGKEVRDLKELLLKQNNTGDSQPSRRQYTRSSGTSLKKPPSGRKPVPFQNATNTIGRSSSTTTTAKVPRVANLDSRKPPRKKFEPSGPSGSRPLPW